MQVSAGIYCRISYVKRKDGAVDLLGVERQEPPCRDLVERLDGTVVDTYIDNDTSAWSGKRRKDYERLLEDLRAGRINTLVAWQADRFIRRVRDAGELLDVVQAHGGQLLTVTGTYDLSTAAGRFNFRNMANMAEMESDLKSERLMLKHDQLAEAGKPKGTGARPFGFRPNLVDHDPDEAALIREAAERLLNEEPMSAIVRDFQDRGVRTVKGAVVTTSPLRRVLLSPRTAGLRQHRGEVVGEAVWEEIISPNDQERLKLIFTGRDRQRLGAPAQSLLAGIARCGVEDCGRPLTSDGKRGYACRRLPQRGIAGCGRLSVRGEPLERYVVARLLDRLAGDGLARMIRALSGHDPDHATLARQIAADEDALKELERDRYHRRDAAGRPLVSADTYPALRDELQARIDAARRQQRPRPEAKALMDLQRLGGKLADAWHRDEITLEQKRVIVRAAIPELVIHPARRGAPPRFDPDARVKLRWVDQRGDDS